MMTFRPLLAISYGFLLTTTALRAQTDILFVGNSFTHGNNNPAMTYNAGQITDANGTGYGGVAGIFKAFTTEEGLNYNVTIEAVSSQTLLGHYASKSAIIGQPGWDVVVLQEQSITPLPTSHGGDPADFFAGVAALKGLINSSNPSASIFLYETWASPTSVTNQGYTSSGGLQAMQNDLRDATFAAYYNYGLAGVARVGEGFMRAVDLGVADADPNNGITPGMINLWAGDVRHASAYGSYLSAAILYAQITGADPRSLSVGVGSAAAGLGLNASSAEALNGIAYNINAMAYPAQIIAPAPTKLPVTAAGLAGNVSGKNITGNATLASLQTDEGSFTGLYGATASNVVTTNSVSSLGSTPASAAAAVTGLTLNDGINNLQSGDFQFALTLSADSRFFIVESAPQSGSLGDAATITLINALNQQVGTYSLTLSVSDFTSSAANNTSSALATLTYTSGQGTLTAKLGAASFAFADFSGSGDLSQVTGLHISSTTLDPNVVGMYYVPEGNVAALLGLAATGLLFTRRRSRRQE